MERKSVEVMRSKRDKSPTLGTLPFTESGMSHYWKVLSQAMRQSYLRLIGASDYFWGNILKGSEVGEGRTDRYLLQLSREEKMMSQTSLRIQCSEKC